jgi:hypothetical protein
MKNAIVIAAPLLMLGLLYCCWRAFSLFRNWLPAAATVCQSDYSEFQQSDDFWHFGGTIGTARGFRWGDAEDSRLIEDAVMFDDADGKRQHARVKRQVHRGWRPSSVYTIWYGPGHWLLTAGALGCSLGAIFLSILKMSGRLP